MRRQRPDVQKIRRQVAERQKENQAGKLTLEK